MKRQIQIFCLTSLALIFMAASPVGEGINPASESVKIKKQSTAGFAFLRTHRQGRAGAVITWGMTSNTGVESFLIKRTYEDPADPYSSWELVSTVTSAQSHFYRYTDQQVLPGSISYCIVAIKSDGSTVVSDYSTVRIISHG